MPVKQKKCLLIQAGIKELKCSSIYIPIFSPVSRKVLLTKDLSLLTFMFDTYSFFKSIMEEKKNIY